MTHATTRIATALGLLALGACSGDDGVKCGRAGDLACTSDASTGGTGGNGDSGAGGSGRTGPAGTIDAVFFAQTHVQQSGHDFFGLVGNRETLIKVHVVAPERPASPEVKATLRRGGKTLELRMYGPDRLPDAVAKEPGLVQHSIADSFTAFIPKGWMKPGLSVVVTAGAKTATFTDLKIGAPTKVIMNMFDVHYFKQSVGDYAAGWQEELAAKWPVAELVVRRVPNIVFSSLVMPPENGRPALRVTSKEDYMQQTGTKYDGEQKVALLWKSALKAAAGKAGRVSLYFVNIYGVAAGGQGGGFGGVGTGTGNGILFHELGHAFSLPHWGDDKNYPYRGPMYGIEPPAVYMGVHVGPTWGFYPPRHAFIPPTVQLDAVGGTPGTYKKDPMQGGGVGDQEKGYIWRHFSDYSVFKMRDYLQNHVVAWNDTLGSYASWDDTAMDYAAMLENDGVSFPVRRDVEVVSVLTVASSATPAANFVYPPIGPYVTGLIDLFDPASPTDRARADEVFCPADGCDLSLKIVQNGKATIYMLGASWDPAVDPLSAASLTTQALNVPASGGEVTEVELLLTPDAEKNGVPAVPQVLASWMK